MSAGSIGRSSRPRILLVGIGMEISGSARFLTGLTAGLARRGFDTHLFVVRDGPMIRELDGTDVRVTVAAPGLPIEAGRLRLGVRPFFALRRLIARIRPDVVHTNLVGLDVIGRLAAWSARTPVVMSTQHDINPRPWPVDLYRRMTVGRIAATVACSESVARYCRDVMRVPEDRLFVIDNGTDTAALARAAGPFRQPPAFLTMGALVPAKNHELLLEAFAHTVSACPGATLTISGAGPLRDRLVATIGSLGLEASARIVDPSADVLSVLGAADVYVQASRREGLPQAMLEAMAAGKPVIATDVSSHASVLDAGRCGVLVPPDDACALADAMLSVARDAKAAGLLGDAGAERVRSHYSLDRMVDRYASLYERLVEASGRLR